MIVVAGDAELGHRVPVIELRIRRRSRTAPASSPSGPAGPAWRRCAEPRTSRPRPAPRTRRCSTPPPATASWRGALGEGGAVLVWSGPMRAEVAAVLAHIAHTAGCSVLRTPRAANEIGCAAAGLGSATPEQALELAEAGKIQAIVLLGADPVGDLARRRALAGRARALLLRPPGDGVPERLVRLGDDDRARVGPAREGRARSPTSRAACSACAGRPRRRRASPTASPGQPSWPRGSASTCPTTRRPHSPTWPRRPAFAGMSWSGIGEHAPLHAAPGRTGAARRAADGAGGHPPDRRRRLPPADVRAGRRPRARGCTSSAGSASRSPTTTPQSLGVATGDRVKVRHDGRTVTGPALVSAACAPASCGWPARVPHVGPGSVAAAPAEGASA